MFLTQFMAPTVVISCPCGDVFAGYENGLVIKLRDAEYGESGMWVGASVQDYREDPECSNCFNTLSFTAL